MNILNKQTALKLMIGLLTLVILFHLCVLAQVISYEKVWAGRINSLEEMRVFESVSIAINVLLITVLFFKTKNLKNGETNKIVNAILWIFVVLFVLNTIGNLFAKDILELFLGTTLTFVSAFLCWVIVKKQK